MVIKTAVIFGASGGIGKVIQQKLQYHFVTRTKRVDVTNEKEVVAYAKELKSVDVVIYCVGKIISNSIETTNINDFKNIFDINVFGAVNVTKVMLPIMTKNGHFIFISSLRALESSKNKAAYCSSKAALDMFANVLRKEAGIKVTIVRPGYVDTDIYGEEQLYPYSTITGDRMKVLLPKDVADMVLLALQLGTIKEINIGEVYGERPDICFRKK